MVLPILESDKPEIYEMIADPEKNQIGCAILQAAGSRSVNYRDVLWMFSPEYWAVSPQKTQRRYVGTMDHWKAFDLLIRERAFRQDQFYQPEPYIFANDRLKTLFGAMQKYDVVQVGRSSFYSKTPYRINHPDPFAFLMVIENEGQDGHYYDFTNGNNQYASAAIRAFEPVG